MEVAQTQNRYPSQIEACLRQLSALWVDATPASLQRIPALCEQIVEATTHPGLPQKIDPSLLRRVELLSAKAEARLEECLAIQTRTGSYSTLGALEVAPRLVTAGWEG